MWTDKQKIKALLEEITQFAFDDDTPIEDICADFEKMREIAQLILDMDTGE